ncbi:hypothetical protein Hanom_Chr08g00709691 [Helianthus anomalus]
MTYALMSCVTDLAVINFRSTIPNRANQGEFIFLEHASRWLRQSVGIPGRDKSFG